MARRATVARTTSMVRTTRLARMAGMERMSTDLLSRQVALQISLPVSRWFFLEGGISRTDIRECRARDGGWRQNTSLYAPTHMRWLKMSWAFESVFSQKSSCCHVFHRNLLGVPDPPPLSYPASYGIRHNLRRSIGWFTLWPKSWADPISCYEPEDLIDISSEYTPITFPSRKNSFTTDIDDVPTVVASDITETIEAGQLTSPLFTQEREVSANPFGVSVFQPAASGSQQQPNFKTEVCVTTPFLQLSMSWINEVEMARSMNNLMTSQSIEGRRAFPDFEMLDARIASPLRKIIFNTSFICRVSVEEQRAQKQHRFLKGRQIASMINDHFSSYRSLRSSSRPIRLVQNLPTEWRRSRFRYKMGPNSVRNNRVTSRECPGMFVQYEVARVPINFKLCWLCTNKNWMEIK